MAMEEQRTGSSKIIEVGQAHTEHVLYLFDICCIAGGEDFINVRDDRLDVGGAVLRHMRPDDIEITPEVAAKSTVVNDAVTRT